jgi:hypothetical protein
MKLLLKLASLNEWICIRILFWLDDGYTGVIDPASFGYR